MDSMSQVIKTGNLSDISMTSESMHAYAPLFRRPPLQYNSLADKAYEYILTEIVFPDENSKSIIQYAGKITESTIARELGMSNGPVREAIFRLRHEGWIETISNRGSYFIDFRNPGVAVEIYRFRLTFETGAFFSLAGTITREQIAALNDILERMEKAKEQKAIVLFREADVRFHLLAAEYAGGGSYATLFRSKLLQWYAMAYHVLKESMGTERYRYNLEAKGSPSHRDLLDSLASHDQNRAAQLIKQHLSFIAHLLGIEDK